MAYSGPLSGNAALEAVKEWAEGKLADKAAASHTHQQSDITGLTDALAGKAPLSHTHVCTDVTDLETKLSDYAKKSDITNVYKWKGTTTWSELIALTNAQVGDVYSVTDKDGMNYGCITANTAGESSWDALGSITNVDLSDYYTITQVDSTFLRKTDAQSTYAPISHTHEIADVNGLQTALDGKAPSSHSHTASQITDFTASVEALLPEEMTKEQALAILNGTGA